MRLKLFLIAPHDLRNIDPTEKIARYAKEWWIFAEENEAVVNAERKIARRGAYTKIHLYEVSMPVDDMPRMLKCFVEMEMRTWKDLLYDSLFERADINYMRTYRAVAVRYEVVSEPHIPSLIEKAKHE